MREDQLITRRQHLSSIGLLPSQGNPCETAGLIFGLSTPCATQGGSFDHAARAKKGTEHMKWIRDELNVFDQKSDRSHEENSKA